MGMSKTVDLTTLIYTMIYLDLSSYEYPKSAVS